MDWDSYYRRSFRQRLRAFEFSPRPVTIYELCGSAMASELMPTITKTVIHGEQALSAWLVERSETSTDQMWPKWSLTVMALERAPMNVFETANESSGPNLTNLGLSEDSFVKTVKQFNFSKAFLHTLESDRSRYSYQHPESNVQHVSYMSFNIRSSPILLNDKALTLRYNASTASTFALMAGCTEDDLRLLDDLLRTMQNYAGHPLLMMALFFNMSHRDLRHSYGRLRASYLEQFFDAFSEKPGKFTKYRQTLEAATNLYERFMTGETEIAALLTRITRLQESFKFVADHAQVPGERYINYHGGRMVERLFMMTDELKHLQEKCASAREGLQLLITSLGNMSTLSKSEVSQQISIASKRDSSIMMAIAVGTLTFLPATAMASIFAMPILDWKAAPGHKVFNHYFWVYLGVTIPITILTLMLLFLWILLVDYEADTMKLVVKKPLRDRMRRAFRLQDHS